MATIARSSDPDFVSLPDPSSDARPPCECRHGDRPDARCGAEATARVTVVCVAGECDCATSAYLLCSTCLAVWRERQQEDGIQLRVRPL